MNTIARLRLFFLSLLLAPFAAQAQSTCYDLPPYTFAGGYSGSFTYTMRSCSSNDGNSVVSGTYTFSNYAETAGDSIDGGYDFSYTTDSANSQFTVYMNGGPVVYFGQQVEIYYDQFSYTFRFDPNTYQYSYLNFSGGWRINGVYYPASTMVNYVDLSGGVPSIDVDDLGTITPPSDTTPDAFSFAATTGTAPGAVVESGTIVVQGITATAPIAVSGGEYSINGGAWTAAAGTAVLGNQVKVRLTAPAGYGATGSATLTIGDVSASFSVTTRSFTPVAAVTEVFSNAGTVASVVDGVVRIAAAPSAPLQLAAGAVQNAVVAFDTAAPVPVLSGAATLNYTRGGSDTALQIRTVAGSPALTPISGSVDIQAPAAGSTIPVTGDSGGSATLVTGSADTQVTAGRDASRNLVVAVTTGPVTYSSTAARSSPSTRSTRSLPTSFAVYPGEAVLADDSGAAGQVRLGSFAQDGSQAGDYLANLPHAASTLNVPRVAGASERFGAAWATLVGQAIAAKLGLGTYQSLAQDATSGVMTLVTSTGTYRFLPVGTLALADAALNGGSRAVSVADIAANLTAILDGSLSFAVAPATAYADLETALKSISAAATLEVLGDGVLKASLSGTDYIAQPASQATDGSTAGCPGFVTENNQLALCDASGRRQVLNAAFADTDTLRGTFRASLNLPDLAVTNAGANGAYAALVGGTPYTLSPDITLTTPPASQAGNLWWQDAASGKIYIRYPNGSAQGFGLQ